MSLPKRWEQLRRHDDHNAIIASQARFVLMRAGRRSGKTEISKRRLVESLAIEKPWTNPLYFYAAPTRQQAKEVAWADLKALTPPDWLDKRPSETELKITTVFGSSLQVVGLDQPQRIEGKGYDGGVVDEMSDVKPQALTVSIFPAMADRHGWLWLIGVPKRAGVGAVYFNKLFDTAKSTGKMPGTSDRIEAYSWESSTVLTEEQLAFFQSIMTKEDFDEQFRAMIQSVGGSVFHSFGPHNIETVEYNPDLPVMVGTDFNVSPMSWVLCHEVNGVLSQFGEIWRKNTNTPATLDYLYSRYGQHSAGWFFFGDATSRARKTAATKSDFIHILNDSRFVNKKVVIPKSNPRILDRLSSCNAKFLNAMGQVGYNVDPSCEKTIEDLTVLAFKEGTMDIDCSDPMVGHISDALGYLIHSRYPITLPRPKASPQVGFF